MSTPLRVMISPSFDHPDQGDGGIRRVVEAQKRHLPAYGVEVVDREQDADLVAVHAGSMVATAKPMVAHCHGLYWTDEYHWTKWAHDLNRQVIDVLRGCDAATAPSDWVGYILKRGMNLDAQTVYHGLDVGDWQSGDKSKPYVLWNKTRVDPICDPAPVYRLATLMPETHFVTTYFEGSSNKPDNVHITGRVPYQQAKNMVQNATIYLATARETFGIGTLEAMASGAVVVGFDWGGQAEILRESGVGGGASGGILVKPYDYGALADAVREALANHAEYAARARGIVEAQFTWEKACAKYAYIYNHTYEQRPRKRVSVVITCYNLAESLPRAVASVDMADAEIVVVDDASPDATADVAKRLAHDDPRIKIVTNESNLYLAGSLNAGVRVSSGAYVVPLDADNELAPGALNTLAAALDASRDVDVAYGSMKVVEERADGSGKVFVSGWPTQFTYEQQMAHRNQIPSTSMYRRKWWDRAGGYRRRCRTAEDADFWCRITSLGAQPKKVTEQPTLIYHDRNDSMSHVEADWAWEAWYPWGRIRDLTPFGAPAAAPFKHVPTYEPAMITVVIPVGRDHEKYLWDALDSLWAQTFVQWRVVVVDDRPYTYDRQPLWLPPWATRVQPAGRGPAHARNAGLLHSDTPYVLFLDADDYLAPNALELLIQAALERNNPYEWYYSDWYKQEEAKIYRAPDFNVEHLRTHLTHSVTAMYPTPALLELGGFDTDLDAWEDWDLILKLIEHGLCGVHLPYPLLYYRYSTGFRREELYKDRTRHTEVMKAKWRKYMVENAPMPCGCQGGRTTYSSPVQVDNRPIPVSKDGTTLVEFVGTSAPRTYRGQRREYRFGSDSGHKMHYVNNEDLPIFINRPGFQLAISDTDGMAILDAKGPPNRDTFSEPPAFVPSGAG